MKEKFLKRSSGVLMPIFSLPGKYSCGSFGQEAKEFAELLAKGGFSYWQVLPFCMTDEYNSPYKSYSAFGGNPRFIDLDILAKKGLLTAEELASATDAEVVAVIGTKCILYRESKTKKKIELC